MKDYYKVLEIQQSIMSRASRINKYVKIKVHTQDESLKELLEDRIRSSSGNTIEDLRRYCTNQIELQIPAWQVAARKAGWLPPNKEGE